MSLCFIHDLSGNIIIADFLNFKRVILFVLIHKAMQWLQKKEIAEDEQLFYSFPENPNEKASPPTIFMGFRRKAGQYF